MPTDPLARKPLLLATLCLLLCASAKAQGNMPMPPMEAGGGYTGVVPQFDVISVRPHKGSDDLMSIHWGQSDYKAVNLTVKSMISNVYNVKVWLLFGLPPWAESMHWDMDAKVSAPDVTIMQKLTPAQRREMISGILKDRFGLVVHHESKVQPVFLMTVLPGESRLKPSAPIADAERDPKKIMAGTWHMGLGSLEATRMRLPTLADNLSAQAGRTIVDKTGLTGEYDIHLTWTPEDRTTVAADDGTIGDTPPALSEALKEQLGLKLTADKAPVPTIVVDHVQQPDAN